MLYARGARVLPRPNRSPLLLRRRQHRRSGLWSLAVVGFVAVVVGIALASLSTVSAAAGGIALWSNVSTNLPDVNQVGPMDGVGYATSKIYDRTGKLLTQIADPQTGYRTPVGYQEILDHITQQQSDPNAPHQAFIFDATVAAEDSSFWTNQGINPTAIARSFAENLSGAPISGASTITQQLVRLLYPNRIGDQQSYTRKIREAIVAYQFTQHYTKTQILEMYLNDIYYGDRAYGIDAASMTFFNEHPWQLTLGEAAMLAGLPQAPSAYDPYQNYTLMKARQHYVLDQMAQQGVITQQAADDAYAQALPLVPQGSNDQGTLAPAWVNFVEGYLEQKYGSAAVYGGGLIVQTTLDYNLQQQAQQIVSSHVQDLAGYHIDNGALVGMLPWDGEIVTMVGSADYYNTLIRGAVNVTLQPRSPGSSIKPVTYTAAFARGFYPGTILHDIDKQWPIPGQPGKFYHPHNDTLKHYGNVTIRTALDNSLNIPAVETLDYIGVPTLINLDHAMGNHSTLYDTSNYGLSLTLGGGDVTLLEHTNVFATLANEGRYVPYTPLLEVSNAAGQTLFKLDRAGAYAQGQQVVPAANAFQTTSVLTDNNARGMIFGTNSPLNVPELNRPVAAKTGTSENSEDGLTMGYTTDLVVGVWTGNTDNSPTLADGVVSAGPIWHDFMVAAHQPRYAADLAGPDGKPVAPAFPQPSNIVFAKVCNKPTPEPIIKGTEHTVICDAGAP